MGAGLLVQPGVAGTGPAAVGAGPVARGPRAGGAPAPGGLQRRGTARSRGRPTWSRAERACPRRVVVRTRGGAHDRDATPRPSPGWTTHGVLSDPRRRARQADGGGPRAAPRKSFGYLILRLRDQGRPTDFVLFEENIRNESRWRESFEAYGDYFVLYPDAGFVATADEAWRVEKEILRRGAYEVGVFHSHQRHPANFSRIDYDLHLTGSTRSGTSSSRCATGDTGRPRVRPEPRGHSRDPSPGAALAAVEPAGTRVPDRAARDDLRSLLALDAAGPTGVHRRGRGAVRGRAGVAGRDSELTDALLTRGFLRGSRSRFEDLVAPRAARGPGRALPDGLRPRRPGQLLRRDAAASGGPSPYSDGRDAGDRRGVRGPRPGVRRRRGRDCRLPVTGVSWPGLRCSPSGCGARLPTEAQWEYACGVGADTEWCCATEAELGEYAWFCANSGGRLHPVGERRPNWLGLHDLHGNVVGVVPRHLRPRRLRARTVRATPGAHRGRVPPARPGQGDPRRAATRRFPRCAAPATGSTNRWPSGPATSASVWPATDDPAPAPSREEVPMTTLMISSPLVQPDAHGFRERPEGRERLTSAPPAGRR